MKEILNTENRRKYLYIICVSMLFALAAHGYRMFNNLYAHDALLDMVEDNIQYQRSLGRFMQTFSILVRGSVCVPWIIGLVGVLFISLSAFLVTDILNISGRVSVALVTGFMICNIVMTTSAASFIPWFDVYCEALFFAVLGVWLFEKDNLRGYICGCVSLIVSLGLYQAYIDVTLLLLLIVFMKAFRDADRQAGVWIKAGKTAGALAVSAIVYYALFKLVCIVHNVSVGDGYNSLSNMEDYSDVSFAGLIANAYKSFFSFFFGIDGLYAKVGARTEIWTVFVCVASVIALLLVVGGVVLISRKKRVSAAVWIIQILGLVLVPIAANAVCIISKGMEHVLMTYSFIFVFIWAISLWEEGADLFDAKWVSSFWTVALVIIAVCVWNNVVFSNQIYYRLDLQETAFESFTTRMAGDIESTEGYQYGVTNVIFYGSFEKSPYIQELPYLSDIKVSGVEKTPVSYMGVFTSYTSLVLNLHMNYEFGTSPTQDIEDMPCYPSAGSIVMQDGALIVKISD